MISLSITTCNMGRMAAHMPARGPLDDCLIGISGSAAGECSVNVEMENPESCEEQAGRLCTVGAWENSSLSSLLGPKINFFCSFSARGLSARLGLATPGLE